MSDSPPTSQDLLNGRPWCHGPVELLRHADGHLHDGGDTDRRIALIGFDNAIEVCIEVWVNLHPRLRGGYEITRERKTQALRSYHTKIEFLEEYTEENALDIDLRAEAIIWFHTLRNELYHSGNGMVPELHVVRGARDCAGTVFKALFGFDPVPLLRSTTSEDQPKAPPPSGEDQETQTTSPPYEALASSGQDPRMEFLSAFIGIEKALRSLTEDEPRATPTHRLLQNLSSSANVHPANQRLLQQARTLRNALVHGGELSLGEAELDDMAVHLFILAEELNKRGLEALAVEL